MPKYRLLSLEELNELEKEFVDFLVLNSILPADWEQLKNDGKADPVIEQFSEVVFETIMRKVEFLEWFEEKEIKTFQCLPDKLVVVGLNAGPDSEINFSDMSLLRTAFQNPPGDLKVYTSEKAYSKERERELFDMIEAGCTISDGKLFKSLCVALKA